MEMVSMNQLIIKIMNFAQTLVDADRASLFLVDAKTNQLYARIFDIKGGDKDGTDQAGKDIAKEIR
jgi:cAMP and cAMP-inhibited cGMP 3',5'-cyclic phosphodiesterase 10